MNDPLNLNALSENMIDLMHKHLEKAAKNKDVRVIIISAEGSTFSSGHDLKELQSANKNSDKEDEQMKPQREQIPEEEPEDAIGIKADGDQDPDFD